MLADTWREGPGKFGRGREQRKLSLEERYTAAGFSSYGVGPDLRNVAAEKAVELWRSAGGRQGDGDGHIFKLGQKISKSLGATALDKDGKEVMPIMVVTASV